MFRDWGRGRLPSEGKGHTFESCRVRQLFLYFTTRYARPNRSSSSVSFKRVSNLEKSPASADSSATDDVGQKLEQLLLRSAFAVIAGSLFDCLPDTVSLPKVEVMGMISVLGLAANLTPVLLLSVSWTGHHCWLRSILANRIEIRTAWRSGYGRVPQCRC